MTRFEKCWIFALIALVAIGNVLTLTRMRELENAIAQLESREQAAEMPAASLRMAQQPGEGAARRERSNLGTASYVPPIGRVHGLCLLRVRKMLRQVGRIRPDGVGHGAAAGAHGRRRPRRYSAGHRAVD